MGLLNNALEDNLMPNGIISNIESDFQPMNGEGHILQIKNLTFTRN